jgi:3-phosphoglycerate kinase
VVILASILIGLGVFQMVTKIEISQKLMSTVEYVVMFGALYLLLVLPKQYDIKKQNAKADEDDLTQQPLLEETEKDK